MTKTGSSGKTVAVAGFVAVALTAMVLWNHGQSECGQLTYLPPLNGNFLALEGDSLMEREAEFEAAWQDVSSVSVAAEWYCISQGRYPADFEALVSLGARASFRGRCVLPGPDEVLDSWGTPIRLGMNGSSVSVRSAGPDRVFANEDDLFVPDGGNPALSSIPTEMCAQDG